MKELNTFHYWNGEYKPGTYTAKRHSRWIAVKQAYDVTNRHSLYDFSQDENGYHPYQDKFNPENGTYLDYFVWNGRKYAIEQFIAYGGAAEFVHYYGYIENGKKHYFSGYDSMTMFNSMLVEFDEYCEHVRVYFDA